MFATFLSPRHEGKRVYQVFGICNQHQLLIGACTFAQLNTTSENERDRLERKTENNSKG